MSFIGNLIWIILGGLLSAIGWTIAGLLLCLTVIGIPFGLQCFKIAGLSLAPLGKTVSIGDCGAGGLIGNVIWILVLGWELFVMHLVFALLLAITIIGLPFAKQHIKLAQLAILPFGARF